MAGSVDPRTGPATTAAAKRVLLESEATGIRARGFGSALDRGRQGVAAVRTTRPNDPDWVTRTKSERWPHTLVSIRLER